MRKLSTAHKVILGGLLLGFVVKMIEDNIPGEINPGGYRFKTLFKFAGFTVGYNDASQFALWILLYFFKGTIGAWAFAGLLIHQLLFYYSNSIYGKFKALTGLSL